LINSKLPGNTQRFYYLDSARGLAALSVITWHFITAFIDIHQSGIAAGTPLHFFWYGEADVVFFFIHSGFILAYSYTGSQKPLTATSYLRFLIERVFRIYPLFIFILVVSFVLKNSIYPLTAAQYTSSHMQVFWTRNYDVVTLLKESVLFIAIPKEGNLRLIPQDWTLTVEIVVGGLIPLMAFLIRRSQVLFWLTVFAAIALFKLNTYIFEFACGIFIFYNWQHIQLIWSRLQTLLKLGFFALAIVLYTCLFYFSSLFNYERVLFRPGVDRLLVITGCCLLFSILISSSRVQKILSMPLLVKAGQICYSVYLVHMVLLICFADYFMRLLHSWFIAGKSIYLLIAFIVYMLITVLISLVTYALIEKPFNKAGKKISAKMGVLLAQALQ